MKSVSCYISLHGIRNIMLKFVVSLTLVGLVMAQSSTNISTNVIGSGKKYRTTVERHTQGELSAEDLHQASLLSAQMLLHLNEAAQRLTDGRANSAKAEINKAETLTKLVRELLPVTTVTTTVTDIQGMEKYRDVQHLQDDLISIFTGSVAVEVVEPIVEAKKDEAALKGLKLTDADLIRTSVLVDLNYVERKLRRANELIAKPQDAAAELVLAQTQGVRFVANKQDSPLVNVQLALRLAERMVQQKKFDGAKANLQTAKIGLEAYRGLIGEAAGKQVADLEKEIQKLSGDVQSPGAEGKIRGFWDKVTSWFKSESGQAHQTTTTTNVPSKQ